MPEISSKKPYRIGRAKTGLGLFATKPIKKGAKIIRYIGPMLDCRKKKDDAIENKYLFQIDKRWTIDGSVRKNVARYINHACKPNAESDVSVRKRKVVIRAIKNIAPGDEINYDYGTEYFKEYLKPIGCKCDACEKKREKKRAEAHAEKAKDKLKAQKKADKTSAKTKSAKTKSSKTKPAKGKAAKKTAPKGKTSKSKTSKGKTSKTVRAKTARSSERRTVEYARAASSGVRPGPRARSAARASHGTSLRDGSVGA